MFDLWADVRQAFRQILAAPRHSGLIFLTLALGIGANTAVFSIVDETMLRPVPFVHPDRIVDVADWDRRSGGGGNSLTPRKVVGWQAQNRVFERLEAYEPRTFDISAPGDPERASAFVVSTGLFSMLGVVPRIGRAFGADDGRPGSERVAIISDAMWRGRFGGDPAAIGRTIVLNDEPYRVVGVMPAWFRLMGNRDKLWLPVDMKDPGAGAESGRFYGIARLVPGAAIEAVQQRADVIADQLQRTTPLRRTWDIRLRPKRPASLDVNAGTILLLLLGAVALVLLIACANVASMLLSRTAARERETAVRAALGASRGRLIRAVLVESAVVSMLGGVSGLALGWWVLGVVVAAAPARLTFMETTTIGIDARVFCFTAVVTLFTGIVFGLLPALRGSRPDVETMLRGSGQTLAGRRSTRRLSGGLVAAEVAIAVVLLVGATLMMRTFANLHAINPGFELNGLIALEAELGSHRYPTDQSRAALMTQAAERIGSVPGATVAFATGPIPRGGEFVMGGAGFTIGVEADGVAHDQRPPIVGLNNVSPRYFQTLRIPVVAGREFAATDGDDVVVVNEPLARHFWPDGSALGRRIRTSREPWRTVVGIVAGVETRIIDRSLPMQVYFSAVERSTTLAPAENPARRSYRPVIFLVRTSAGLDAVPAIKAQLRALDPQLPVERVARAADMFADAFDRERFVLLLMTAFASLALVLAASGIFAVLSQLVAQRTREIGVRVALGAARGDIVRLVVGHGLLSAGIGLASGLAGAAALTRVMRSLLYEVGPYDPASFVAVAVVIVGVACVACWLPTRRALRVEPAVALRVE